MPKMSPRMSRIKPRVIIRPPRRPCTESLPSGVLDQPQEAVRIPGDCGGLSRLESRVPRILRSALGPNRSRPRPGRSCRPRRSGLGVAESAPVNLRTLVGHDDLIARLDQPFEVETISSAFGQQRSKYVPGSIPGSGGL